MTPPATLDAPTAPLSQLPDARGRFGDFGGVFIPETLHHAVTQLADAYDDALQDPTFQPQLDALLRDYVGRATPLYHAKRLTEHVRQTSGSGANLWFKREDLAHTGAHKINNALGQALLTQRMGKSRIIAETGAGQHGVATATACAMMGLECVIYMGEEDIRRQQPNVKRMRLLGATVAPVSSGSRTLKDATNEAMRDWMGTSDTTHYIIGSVVGPHPFPMIVRDFQAVIGRECRQQCLDQIGRLPDAVVACVGGGSNAAGIFYPFIDDAEVSLYGVEAGGRSTHLGDHAAPLNFGSPGVLHGSLSYVLQDPDGQTAPVHSCSAGLDYPGVGPEHSHWHDTGRVAYTACNDADALEAFQLAAQLEGIIPALETSHAIHATMELAKTLPPDAHLVLNCSGRGDKDLDEALRLIEQT
ncbi:MAG: tryptophan synthase subunit beta [Planctomycetota bacterium]